MQQLELVASQDDSGLVVVMVWDGCGGKKYCDPVFYAGALSKPPVKLQAAAIEADEEYGGVRCSFTTEPLQGWVLNFHRLHGQNTIRIKGGDWGDVSFPRGCYVGIPTIADRYARKLEAQKWPDFTWRE